MLGIAYLFSRDKTSQLLLSQAEDGISFSRLIVSFVSSYTSKSLIYCKYRKDVLEPAYTAAAENVGGKKYLSRRGKEALLRTCSN